MIPFLALLCGTLIFRLLGLAGIPFFASWQHALRAGLAVMLFLTASAHWGRKRADLLRMVPPRIPFPQSMTLTGLAEIAGAIGLLWPGTAPLASVGLILLLIAVFPANIYAARHSMTIGGSKVTGLRLRAVLQAIFLFAIFTAGFGFPYLH